MDNYEDKSDDEINSAVQDIVETEWQAEQNCLIDYCNSPSDAWPIITENRIALMPDVLLKGQWNCGTLKTGSTDYCQHENPLRAAMIVFLKMQEAS